jgi:hypothetical protein
MDRENGDLKAFRFERGDLVQYEGLGEFRETVQENADPRKSGPPAYLILDE